MRRVVPVVAALGLVALPAGLRSQTPPAAAPASHVIVAHSGVLAWAPGPPSLPPGAQFVLLEGNPAEAVPLTLRLTFPPNYRVPPHYHSVIEHVTVLSGTLNVGMGEQPTYSGGTALAAGSFAAMPQKMVHYAWTGPEGVVFQLHSVGPWSITYVNPADDPRNAKPAGGR
jgi:quercetin dioxygenase-like cupin family protein